MSEDAYASAVLLAAGRSARMGLSAEGLRKPFLCVAGRSLIEHALATFGACPSVREIILVAHPDDMDAARKALSAAGLGSSTCIEGGAERTDSVRLGFERTTDPSEVILIHDVARPLVLVEQIEGVARAARESGGALLATPVRDTIKMVDDGRSVSTLDRSRLWAAQTPQGFRRTEFAEALEMSKALGMDATDDAALYERHVGHPVIVESGPENLKLTVPADVPLAEALLRRRSEES